MLAIQVKMKLQQSGDYSPAAKGGDPKFSDIVFFSADYLSLGSK